MFLPHNCSVLQVYSEDLKVVLRVGFTMFSVTESNSLYIKIFRFFTILERKLFRVSAVSDSVFLKIFIDTDFISSPGFV